MRLSSSRVQASDTAAHMRVLLNEVAAAVERADTMKGRGLCLHGPYSDTAAHMRVLLKEVAAAVERADTMKGRGLCLQGPGLRHSFTHACAAERGGCCGGKGRHYER